MASLLGQRLGKEKDWKIGNREVWGRGKWVALWEWTQSRKIFVKHIYIPQQASTTGKAE